MISDQGQLQAAVIMRDASETNRRAAEMMQEACQQMRMLLEDGYGGNGLLLLETLKNVEHQNATT